MEKPTPEYLRRRINYDPETGRFFWKHADPSDFADRSHGQKSTAKRWNARYAGAETFLNGPKNGYRFQPIRGVHVNAHAAAWAITYGEYPDKQIDHINGIKSDNRISNLRLATPSQNISNTRKREGTSSKYKGVSWHKRYGKWTVSAKIFLGNFDSEEEAAKAYDDAVLKIHGEFARLNFPHRKGD